LRSGRSRRGLSPAEQTRGTLLLPWVSSLQFVYVLLHPLVLLQVRSLIPGGGCLPEPLPLLLRERLYWHGLPLRSHQGLEQRLHVLRRCHLLLRARIRRPGALVRLLRAQHILQVAHLIRLQPARILRTAHVVGAAHVPQPLKRHEWISLTGIRSHPRFLLLVLLLQVVVPLLRAGLSPRWIIAALLPGHVGLSAARSHPWREWSTRLLLLHLLVLLLSLLSATRLIRARGPRALRRGWLSAPAGLETRLLTGSEGRRLLRALLPRCHSLLVHRDARMRLQVLALIAGCGRTIQPLALPLLQWSRHRGPPTAY